MDSTEQNTKKDKVIVDLFKYRFKNIKKFIDRDSHPTDLHPRSPEYKMYWGKHFIKCIEGMWVDDDGTWVFMMPKLYYYINHLTVLDDDRRPTKPWLRDVEWIGASYFLCLDGFSGFEDDPDYTCHHLVKKAEDGTLEEWEKESDGEDGIPPSAYRKNGKLKAYIEPWYFLTEYYLTVNPRGPLGRPRYDNPRKNGMIFSGRGLGKALRPTEQVRIPNGWEQIQNLKPGDKVYGGDGKLTNVLDVFTDQKDLNFYRLTLADGRTIDACEDHQWKVFDRKAHNGEGHKRGGWKVLSTKDMVAHHKKKRIDSKYRKKHGVDKFVYEHRYALPLTKPISQDLNEVTIPPYVLGSLLGDGSMCGDKSSTTLTSGDPELLEQVDKLFPSVSIKSKRNHEVLNYGRVGSPNGMNDLLQGYGLLGKRSHEKFIPKEYLFNTEEVKMELLKGLMDTDGYASDRGIIEYYTSSPTLADDFEFLVRSLGIGLHRSVRKTHYKKDGVKVEGKDCYRFRLFTDRPVFTLKRKLGYLSHKKSKAGLSKQEKTFITNIEPIGKSDGVCIRVDNEDNTFITKDHIVTHNSLIAFIMDFCHEWTFSGVQYIEDAKHVNSRLLFAMACGRKTTLSRSIKNISYAMTKMPGSFRYPLEANGKRPKPCLGAFYKTSQGSWSAEGETQHIVKRRDNSVLIEGSSAQSMILQPQSVTVASGDRFRRIYLEEAGFIGNLIDIYGANEDSVKLSGFTRGSMIMTGTGGDMKNIRQPKRMFENPEPYNIFSIPNYWNHGEGKQKVGLFIPSYYKYNQFRDENGNTDKELSLKYLFHEREMKAKGDSVSYANHIMFNPIAPAEMLRPAGGNLLPKVEAAEQLAKVEGMDIFRSRAMVGLLKYDERAARGVDFELDVAKKLTPITSYDTSDLKIKSGAVILYEQPPLHIPENLYWIVFDPVGNDGDEGGSFNSVLVYKYMYSGGEQTVYDNIVGEWLGRMETVEEAYDIVLRFCLYFNAKVFPETNSYGFVRWMQKKGHYSKVENDAFELERSINPNGRRGVYSKGVFMDARKKTWALKRLKSWLLEVKKVDEATDLPSIRTIDWLVSPRILDEIIAYERDSGNFDHISSLLVLMVLLGKIENLEPAKIGDPWEDVDYETVANTQTIQEAVFTRKQRCAFLDY